MSIFDVADRSGVSIATVSRVLSGRKGVSEAKRLSVLSASQELGYVPDSAAASLRSGVTRSVGIVVPDITNPFFPAVLQSAEKELASDTRDLMFCDSNNEVATERLRIQTLVRRRVDALLVCPVHNTDSVAALTSAIRTTRVLQLDRMIIPELDFVGVDHRAGMDQIADHLSAAGASGAAFVGTVPSMSSVTDRAQGFAEAFRARGMGATEYAIDFPDVRHGRIAARRLLDDGLPDALVCANDEVAAGVLMELRAGGIVAPRDVLVTGYDDVPIAEVLGLTTIHQPLQEIGEEAAQLVGDQQSEPRHIRLKPSLIVRATTAR